MRSLRAGGSALSMLVVALGIAVAAVPEASAQPDPQVDGGELAPVQVDTVAAPPVALAAPTSPDASPAAVAACGRFAEALDAAATYYGEFADALDENAEARYADPAVNDSNTLGRTALRQGAVLAMSAANTPGLAPEIANPMRLWSVDATKLLVKMGLRGGGNTLDLTANELNSDALSVQEACAAAGTHA